MDWMILIVVVPLVLVPIVLLYGFSGCTEFGAAEPAPAPPTQLRAPWNVVAVVESETRIKLSWAHDTAGGQRFLVTRNRLTGGPEELPVQVTDRVFSNDGHIPGAKYAFKVRALANAGQLDSPDSDTVIARAWQWKTAYTRPLSPVTGPAFTNLTLVQRFARSLLVYGDGPVTQIRLSIWGGTPAEPFRVNQITVAYARTETMTALDPTVADMNAEDDPQKLLSTPLPEDGTPITLGPVAFPWRTDRDLLVAFDIKPTNTSKSQAAALPPDSLQGACFTKNNHQEATIKDKTSPYQTRNDAVYFVERLDILVT